MANSWLRLWHDMPNDPKWRTIAKVSKQSIPSVIAVYLHILVIASNATERGRTQSVCNEDIASALDLECEQVDQIIAAMQGRVLDGDSVSGWSKRQVEREDGAAGRAKAWREAKKQAKTEDSNATERNRTHAERNQTPDKDTDKDTDKSNTPLPPSGGDVLFSKFWSAYPRKVGKDVARKAFDKRKPSTELVDLMVQAVNRQKMTPQWAKDGGQFIPHPSTWINEGRWMDGEQPGQPDSTWFREAGFDFDWVANNAGCYPSNFKKFANGKRLEAA